MTQKTEPVHLIDLTLPMPVLQQGEAVTKAHEVPLQSNAEKYTGLVYQFHHNSMTGTYIDFPGHIREADNGMTAENYPLEKLYRMKATVIHLDRQAESGGIGRSELAEACPHADIGDALIINALGPRRFDEIPGRSVFLTRDAVDWIIGTGIHLLVSDVYESRSLKEGVFLNLLRHGILTVCAPIHLDQIKQPRVMLTVLPARFPGVTQVPCRALVELSQIP